MTQTSATASLLQHVAQGGVLRLFLDYDGTLVSIAPTPAQARPGAALLNLLASLAGHPQFHPAILSGRPLASLQSLLPVPGLLLAGTYGLEVQWPDGRQSVRVSSEAVRRTVEEAQAAWQQLIEGRDGFFLEDKGAAIALHARFASEADAGAVLPAARQAAAALAPQNEFRVLGGHRFLEVAPALAHKGRSVEWLLAQVPSPGARLAYLGDDDKDEEAFTVILAHGGVPIVVGPPRGPTQAVQRLAGPEPVYEFLASLLEAAGAG